MNKPIFLVLFIIWAVISVFLFLIFKREAGKCKSFSQTECTTKLVCKSVTEFGLACGEGGCQEGEKFVGCFPRF